VNESDHAPKRVLDASALLALLFGEVGFEVVPLEGSAVSAVNWSEVVQVAVRRGADVVGLGDAIAAERPRSPSSAARGPVRPTSNSSA
jgi:predicted nucleic acid-binding protein